MNGVVEAGPSIRTLQEDYDEEVGYNAVQATYDLARKDDGKPWFHVVSFTSPHTPFTCAQAYWDRAGESDRPAVDALPFEALDYHSRALFFAHGRHRHRVTERDLMDARRAYYGMIAFVDDQVGRLMAALEATGQAEDTVVAFTSDHGEMLGERGMWFKQSFFDWSARVPLIVAGPGVAPGRTGEIVSLVDLLPTFAAIGGRRIEVACDGEDLGPALAGLRARDLAISDYTGIGPCVPTRMVRRGRWKLIYTHGHPHLLHDMEVDPRELSNLAGDPAHRETLEGLLALCLDGWNPEEVTARVLASQAERLVVKTTPGAAPDWAYRARTDDGRRYVRLGTGGVDGTKGAARLPRVPAVEPHFPALERDEVEEILRGERPLPSYLTR